MNATGLVVLLGAISATGCGGTVTTTTTVVVTDTVTTTQTVTVPIPDSAHVYAYLQDCLPLRSSRTNAIRLTGP
jgi:hypothetical protein